MKENLRKRLRTVKPTQLQNSIVLKKLVNLKIFQRAAIIAGYVALPQEIDITQLFQVSKQWCVPVVDDSSIDNKMQFVLYKAGDPMVRNKWGIMEPLIRQVVAKNQIDLVLVPMLGFDGNCYRLGRGGGYYDRYFVGTTLVGSPYLLGLAVEEQKLAQTPTAAWDIKLNAIITDKQYYTPLLYDL